MDDMCEEVYRHLLQEKEQDLAAVMRDLKIPQTQENERRLYTRVEQLLQEIEDLKRKINGLSFSQNNNDWDKHIYKIDYQKAQSRIQRVLNRFRRGSGAALFLIQQSQIYCGDYCIQHLRDQLEKCGIVKPYPVVIPPGDPPRPEDFVKNLGQKLLIDITGDLARDVSQSIDGLYKSLTGVSILFLEIHLDLVNPDDAFLEWLLRYFWHELINPGSQTIQCNPNLIIIGVVKIDSKLSSNLRNLVSNNQSLISNDRFLPLAQEKWKVDEIDLWLRRFSLCNLDPNRSRGIATEIYTKSQGDPDRAKSRLLRTLEQLAS